MIAYLKLEVGVPAGNGRQGDEGCHRLGKGGLKGFDLFRGVVGYLQHSDTGIERDLEGHPWAQNSGLFQIDLCSQGAAQVLDVELLLWLHKLPHQQQEVIVQLTPLLLLCQHQEAQKVSRQLPRVVPAFLEPDSTMPLTHIVVVDQVDVDLWLVGLLPSNHYLVDTAPPALGNPSEVSRENVLTNVFGLHFDVGVVREVVLGKSKQADVGVTLRVKACQVEVKERFLVARWWILLCVTD